MQNHTPNPDSTALEAEPLDRHAAAAQRIADDWSRPIERRRMSARNPLDMSVDAHMLAVAVGNLGSDASMTLGWDHPLARQLGDAADALHEVCEALNPAMQNPGVEPDRIVKQLLEKAGADEPDAT